MERVPDRRRFLARVGCGALGGLVGWMGCAAPSASPGSQGAPGAEERLRTLQLELPVVPKPTGALLVPCVRVGDLLYVSGHTPVGADGKPVVGKLGKELDVRQGQEAARLVALRVLSVVRAELGSLDRVVRVVKTLGMVNCTPDFTQTPQVVNGFSGLLVEVFGEEAGKGARSAVGMESLPGGVPVEVEVILQVK
ncbi:MAG TPA: RidA family protein [Planctomycetota bacterium]|nr:RidA family protein [Planctomycetota bacterium]